jgi:colicin import membrane protein
MNSAQTFHSSTPSFKRGRKTKSESTKRAFSLSLAAHLGLLAFLVIGISWNNSTPSGVEVELWDASPQVQAPALPELKTEIKEEAADIVIKKKPVEKEAPKKEVVKEAPKTVTPPKPTPPKEKEPPKKTEPVKKVEAPKAATPADSKANAAAEKVRADQLARLRAAASAEGGSGGTSGSGVGGGGNTPPGWTDKVVKR